MEKAVASLQKPWGIFLEYFKNSQIEVRRSDRIFYGLVYGFSILFFLLLCAIVYELFRLSQPALMEFGSSLAFSKEWNPIRNDYGILAFVFGTFVSSLLALMIATPISIGVALFLTEIASLRVKSIFSFLVEMLAAIPSVVYGLWGLFVLAPFVRTTVQPFLVGIFGDQFFLFSGPPIGVGMFTAALILSIMIIPTISALCREIFETVPRLQKEAALALGATRWESISLGVLKASVSGIFGAVILGLGRALGETMAVTMVIGNRNDISFSLFAPGQTMASVIANEYNEASGLHLSSLAFVGFSLFFLSLVMNIFARLVVYRFTVKQKGLA